MELIKQLREMTGAGMVDCKKALDEAGQDINKAIEILRKKGISKAAKRTDRDTNEGVIKVGVNSDNTEGYIVQVNSETDFVSRNDKFQALADDVLNVIKADKPATLEALMALPMGSGTVEEAIGALSGTIGEKMSVKSFEIVSGASVASYSHSGGRIGVLVALDQAGKEALAADIAMHTAAANPKCIIPSEVDPAEMAKEKEIYKELLIKEGKPENMVEKIVEGKMGKYYSEVCLAEQEYVKDDKKKIKDILGGANILKFIRYSL